MIGLVKMGEQIHIHMNLEAARRAGVKISPQLVSLADVIPSANSASERGTRKILQRSEPEYPQLAAAMSLRGTVRLKIQIAANGSVRRVEYAGGHPLLAQAAITAVQNWKFEPAAKDKVQTVSIDFQSAKSLLGLAPSNT